MIEASEAELDPLLAPLNLQQRAIVSAPVGRARLVLAGPGSGKTRTLVHRVARLMRDGVPPERILLVTFTNKAAREMMARCEALCGPSAWKIMGGTFHGLAAKILREYGHALGLDPEFRILDRADTEDQLRAAVSDLGLDVRRDRLPRVRTLCRMFSASVQRELDLGSVLATRYPQHHHLLEKIQAIGAQFVQRKHSAGVVDFDDLLVGWSFLADPPDHADALLQETSHALRSQFVEVLVDEYQDTNAIQGRIADHMANLCHGLTVVGDDCQGIYGFRGADAQNLVGFEKRFANAERLLLTINYRSTPEILSLANQSIQSNLSRLDKELEPARVSIGLPPWVVQCTDREEEARFVVARSAQLNAEGVPWSEMAVLYRSHALSTELQVQLTKAGIPFVVRSGVRFFEQAHIKDVLAFGRAVLGDDLALRRALLLFQGVGQVSADKAMKRYAAKPSFAQLGSGASGAAARGLQIAAKVLEGMEERTVRGPAAQLMFLVDHYRQHILARFDDPGERSEDLEELIRFAEGFETMPQLLADLPVADQSRIGGDLQGALVLSSIHQSKGLEWSRVFILSLIEGNFPHAASFAEADGVEEERRLFYVASTRAADELYLTYAQRAGHGRLQTPSRFLSELMDREEPPFTMVRPRFD